MANITNANSAYVSGGNGNVYNLMQKVYITPVNSNNGGQISILDGYINYDSQGNFTINGYFNYDWTLGGQQNNSYQTDIITIPNSMFQINNSTYGWQQGFLKYPTLVSVTTVNGTNITSSCYLNMMTGGPQVGSNTGNPLPTTPCNFVITGQLPLQKHVL